MLTRWLRVGQRALIMALGGHDPVEVNNLMARANTLMTCTEVVVQKRKITPLVEKVIHKQIAGIKLHTFRLDPYYAIHVKHYASSR